MKHTSLPAGDGGRGGEVVGVGIRKKLEIEKCDMGSCMEEKTAI